MIQLIINLDDPDDAIKKLKRLQKMIDGFPLHVANRGRSTADSLYSTSFGIGYYGDPIEISRDVTVTADKLDDNSAAINATGSELSFLEFGAGIMAQSGSEVSEINTGQLPFPIGEGTYSATHAQTYVKKGFWHYGGDKYAGIVPTKALQTTVAELKQNTEKIAEEYFA